MSKKIAAIILSLTMIFCMLPLTTFADDAIAGALPIISLDEVVILTVDSNNREFMHAFTPEESGYYFFYSFDNLSTDDEELDTRCYIYNSAMEQLAENDDYNSLNFGLTIYMNAGETYYLKSKPYNPENYGKYSISVER